jgi:hypothetical protein
MRSFVLARAAAAAAETEPTKRQDHYGTFGAVEACYMWRNRGQQLRMQREVSRAASSGCWSMCQWPSFDPPNNGIH